MRASKAEGQSVRPDPSLEYTWSHNSIEHVIQFVALKKPASATFVKHLFEIWLRIKNPQGTVFWELKNLTLDVIIASGTGAFDANDIHYYQNIGGDTIQFKVWLSTGVFEKCASEIFNNTIYQD